MLQRKSGHRAMKENYLTPPSCIETVSLRQALVLVLLLSGAAAIKQYFPLDALKTEHLVLEFP